MVHSSKQRINESIECCLQILCAYAMEISFSLCVTKDTPNFSKQVCMNKDVCEYLCLIQIKKMRLAMYSNI